MDTIMIMKIMILLFDNFTALDIFGPYEVLNKLPNSQISLAGLEKTVYMDTYGLKIQADCSIDEIFQADILLIPGGFGVDTLLKNTELLN